MRYELGRRRLPLRLLLLETLKALQNKATTKRSVLIAQSAKHDLRAKRPQRGFAPTP
jgi:hypothetical protein